MFYYKLKLFFVSCCFYRYPYKPQGTQHDSRGYVSFHTAGVTLLYRCGFKLFLRGLFSPVRVICSSLSFGLSCSVVGFCRSFKDASSFHIKRRVMGVSSTSETSANFQQTTRRDNPEDKSPPYLQLRTRSIAY
jgi:hypothetical protein